MNQYKLMNWFLKSIHSRIQFSFGKRGGGGMSDFEEEFIPAVGWSCRIDGELFGSYLISERWGNLDKKRLGVLLIEAVNMNLRRVSQTAVQHGGKVDWSTLRFKFELMPPWREEE